MLTIITYTGNERPKTDVEINYPEKKNIDEAIVHKSRNKYMYETDIPDPIG